MKIIKNNSLFVLMFVVIIGMTLTSLSSWFFYTTKEKMVLEEYHKEINEYSDALYRDMLTNLESLHALSILFHEEASFDPKRFAYEAQTMLNRHPNTASFMWIPYTNHQKKREYFGVKYIEPLVNNEKKLGLNFASEPVYFDAFKKAINTGKAQLSASKIFVQNNIEKREFIMILPVYTLASLMVSNEKKNLKGFVLASYFPDALFSTASLDDEYDGIEIKIVDETILGNDKVLKVHHVNKKGTAHKTIKYNKKIPEVLGRQWTLVTTPSKSYIENKRDMLPLIILIFGIGFTAFLTIYIYSIVRRSRIIENIVEKKTKALSQANRDLKKFSRTDALTGISNRGFFDEFFKKELSHAVRNKSLLSLILIDIDHFKLYNDTYGHVKGDECLKKVAATLKGLVRRPHDLVARYGGEEFVLLLPNTENSQYMAEKCRKAIEDLQIAHGSSQNSSVVTISAGVYTIFPSKETSCELIIKTADKALYKAKEKGRNQVVQSSDDT